MAWEIVSEREVRTDTSHANIIYKYVVNPNPLNFDGKKLESYDIIITFQNPSSSASNQSFYFSKDPNYLKITSYDFSKYNYRMYVKEKMAATTFVMDKLPSTSMFTATSVYTSYGTKTLVIERELKNSTPTVSVSTENNKTLYENDTLNIVGSARDEDANQSLTVYYQINNETRRVLATDVSQKSIALSKQLTFKGGKLYDGATAVTGALTEGVAHKLKVWAVDDQGASSVIVERTFYVVPNRAPSLTIEPITPSGNIDTDKFIVTGQAGDPDANANVKVTYRINSNNSVEVYNGPGGAFSFDIALGQLVVGQNTIVVEVIDNYGAKTSKTIKLNKTAIETPLLQSTARYKLEPPSGSTKGVLLYIRRDQNLAIDTKISMTLKGEPENFVPMVLENTAPLPNDATILEDEFYYETTEAKDNIILQIDMTRSSTDVSDKIVLIQGAFD